MIFYQVSPPYIELLLMTTIIDIIIDVTWSTLDAKINGAVRPTAGA
jgi:hypothetical protein